jgi:mRNA interferase MazF
MVDLGGPQRTRPALILTRSSAIPYLTGVTVAPITRTIRGIPTEIPLGVDAGLKTASVANLDCVQTVAKTRIGRFLGALGAHRRAEVRTALCFALGLD